jgi:hypothetical protein
MGIFIFLFIYVALSILFFLLAKYGSKRPDSTKQDVPQVQNDTQNEPAINKPIPDDSARRIEPQKPPEKTAEYVENPLPHDFVLTDEFKDVYYLMENSTKCIFITGKAGTGKSTLITYFRRNTWKNVVYLAPTGIAALNISGKTIHSFFKFPLHLIEVADIQFDFKRHEIFKNLDTIVIDEISMARADIVDGINASLQINRKKFIPFGGVQMIFIGDLYQLPPVVNSKEVVKIVKPGADTRIIPLKQYFETEYGGVYFFNSKIFNSVQFENIELTQIFRQKDDQFINLLNSFREQSFTTADLEALNRQYKPGEDNNSNEVRLTICTTNAIANGINEKKYEWPYRKILYLRGGYCR